MPRKHEEPPALSQQRTGSGNDGVFFQLYFLPGPKRNLHVWVSGNGIFFWFSDVSKITED